MLRRKPLIPIPSAVTSIPNASRMLRAAVADAGDELRQQLKKMKRDRASVEERKPLLVEYRNILRMTQETPTSLRNRVKYLQNVYSKYQRAKRGLSEGIS